MTTAEMKQELDKLNERVKQLEAEIEKAESEPEFEIARGESAMLWTIFIVLDVHIISLLMTHLIAHGGKKGNKE